MTLKQLGWNSYFAQRYVEIKEESSLPEGFPKSKGISFMFIPKLNTGSNAIRKENSSLKMPDYSNVFRISEL